MCTFYFSAVTYGIAFYSWVFAVANSLFVAISYGAYLFQTGFIFFDAQPNKKKCHPH